MYDLITGPFLWCSILLFILGSIVKIIDAVMLVKNPLITKREVSYKTSLKHLRASMSGRKPFFFVTTFLFHVILISAPLFQLAHGMIMDKTFGVSFPSLIEKFSDILAFIAVFCGLILLIRRIVKPEVRALTSLYDYFLLLITISPFVLGILAYHQIGNYNIILNLHMLSGELILILLGWTKLGHMYHFLMARLFVATEYNNRRGGWQY